MKAILMVMALAGVAHADDAATVLAKAQKFYASADHLHSKFQQEVTHTFGQPGTSQGNVYVAKPGNVRFDYNNPKGVVTKTFAFDGKTGWFVDNVNKRIQTQKAAAGTALPAAVSFLTGGNLAKQFTVALDTSGTYAGSNASVLKLTPKVTSAQYNAVYFVVEPTDGHVRESVVINSNGEVNHFKFFSPDLESPIEPTLFVIDTHQPGYSVQP